MRYKFKTLPFIQVCRAHTPTSSLMSEKVCPQLWSYQLSWWFISALLTFCCCHWCRRWVLSVKNPLNPGKLWYTSLTSPLLVFNLDKVTFLTKQNVVFHPVRDKFKKIQWITNICWNSLYQLSVYLVSIQNKCKIEVTEWDCLEKLPLFKRTIPLCFSLTFSGCVKAQGLQKNCLKAVTFLT